MGRKNILKRNSQKVVFADSWREFFADFGLSSFDDFFKLSAGREINKHKKRGVIAFSLDNGGRSGEFFMKRFFRPHLKDIFFALRKLGRPCSQAEHEWINANLLLENGIDTYRPVCYGEQTRFGIERKSFLVTEKVCGQALTEFACEDWPKLSGREKEAIIISLGRFIRRIHDAKICMTDLYLWHVFIKENHNCDQYDFAVIDLHRMEHGAGSRRRLLKNLGALYHSMVEEYFDKELKELLIRSYAGDGGPGEVGELIRQVRKYSDAVSAKREPKPYQIYK